MLTDYKLRLKSTEYRKTIMTIIKNAGTDL
jgi:hypothetical protein